MKNEAMSRPNSIVIALSLADGFRTYCLRCGEGGAGVAPIWLDDNAYTIDDHCDCCDCVILEQEIVKAWAVYRRHQGHEPCGNGECLIAARRAAEQFRFIVPAHWR
jgi:hypothetical protein